MDQIAYADILILALIAGFVLLRLRSVLGQKNDTDHKEFFKREEPPSADKTRDSVVQIVGKTSKPKPADELDPYIQTLANPAVASALAEIKKADPTFSATTFLQGAKMAYEMVFDGFAKGDKRPLEMLLDAPIFDTFSREIDQRATQPNKTEITLVAVKAKDITQATLNGTKARLAVAFDSEQVVLIKDEKGNVIEGNPADAHRMDDEWVFERDVASKNPNWKIMET